MRRGAIVIILYPKEASWIETQTMQAQLPSKPDAWQIARRKANQMRHQLTVHGNFNSSSEQIIQKNSASVIEGFRRLRQEISLGGLPVRELIEEGRRF